MRIHIEKNGIFLPVLIGLLLLPASFLFAQEESEKGLPFITNYLPKDYKALPQTWSVIEDNRGIMYFGIQNGILECHFERHLCLTDSFRTDFSINKMLIINYIIKFLK